MWKYPIFSQSHIFLTELGTHFALMPHRQFSVHRNTGDHYGKMNGPANRATDWEVKIPTLTTVEDVGLISRTDRFGQFPVRRKR